MSNTIDKSKQFILWFNEVRNDDVGLVGGKNASLGEMYSLLTPKGIRIPNGFAVTAYAYHHLIEKANLKDKIKQILKDLNTHNIKNLRERGAKVRKLILQAQFPDDLQSAIAEAYKKLSKEYGKNVDVAVRSSATAEDLPDASFAGQQETYLNITGKKQLLEACKKCFASLFTNRAISYRVDKKFDHFSIGLSIGVQKMVRSDKASSGIVFTLDTESGFKDVVFINASYGLGENIVQGAVNPDQYYVFKPTMKQGYKAIISKKVGEKAIQMIYTTNKNKPTRNIAVPEQLRKQFALSDDEIITLSKWSMIVEEHYSQKAGKWKPMDLEWAKDGITKQLFIVQARPETIHSQKDKTKLKRYILRETGKVLAQGNSVGEKIGAGKANIIKDVHDIHKFKQNEVLITDMTDPDWEPIMKIASAIVTNRGGRACHAAIISRELGIPCIVGTNNATAKIKTGQDVTVDSSSGEVGLIYAGKLKYDIEETDLKEIPQTKTKIMINVGDPDQAFEDSFIPNAGVGLAREEFIINSYIKIHPKALLEFDKVKDKKTRQEIEQLTFGYKDKSQFFVDRLASGVAMIAAAFYPKDVIVRMSDFKTNEYANLIGGTYFEPKEDNPMLGWRGAARYYDEKFKDAFALECKAMKKARDEFGLTNIKLLIPMCRTIEEGKKVLALMKQNGLEQGKNGLEVYVMCEIPVNILLADQFLDIFDGFSIGSNDLTQMTLGVDRDSQLVSHVFEERNEAVKKLVSQAIAVCKKRNKHIGICGQAPSDKPDFAEFLVEQGIEAISLNPDTVIKTTLVIAKKEMEMGIINREMQSKQQNMPKTTSKDVIIDPHNELTYDTSHLLEKK
ncbi:phosphoenolpyruvate synthase [Candidatus Woesearchaeota archaeon]|nr:phosphoenolpyruvate synthase [Candidatus Woesearchaeota archaeon]